MTNKRITENLVREHLKNDLLMNTDEVITAKEQKDEKMVYQTIQLPETISLKA